MDWLGLGAGDYPGLREVFTQPELVEVVALSAWQFGGPSMMSSWGAEAYKQNGEVVLDALPVRLAYVEVARSGAPPPPIPLPPLLSTDELLDRARSRQSPPPSWLEFLAPNPHLLSAWAGLYDVAVEGGIVESRIKQLQRVLIAELVDCEAWAPEASPSLTAAGVGPDDRSALRAFDLTRFSMRERAALQYAEALVASGQVSDAVFDGLKQQFSEAEIVELGYAVSVQSGAARVLRSLTLDAQAESVSGSVPQAPQPITDPGRAR